MLVDGRRQLLAADDVLLRAAERLRAWFETTLASVATCLLEHRLQPWLELSLRSFMDNPRSGVLIEFGVQS